MMPLRPNMVMVATARANGGLTMGSSAMTWMRVLRGRGAGTRTWTKAKTKATSVPRVATVRPNMTVFSRIWFWTVVR